MKTVEQIRCAVMSCVWETDTGLSVETKKQDKLLKEWAEELIDECANRVLATRPDTSSQDITEVKDML